MGIGNTGSTATRGGCLPAWSSTRTWGRSAWRTSRGDSEARSWMGWSGMPGMCSGGGRSQQGPMQHNMKHTNKLDMTANSERAKQCPTSTNVRKIWKLWEFWNFGQFWKMFKYWKKLEVRMSQKKLSHKKNALHQTWDDTLSFIFLIFFWYFLAWLRKDLPGGRTCRSAGCGWTTRSRTWSGGRTGWGTRWTRGKGPAHPTESPSPATRRPANGVGPAAELQWRCFQIISQKKGNYYFYWNYTVKRQELELILLVFNHRWMTVFLHDKQGCKLSRDVVQCFEYFHVFMPTTPAGKLELPIAVALPTFHHELTGRRIPTLTESCLGGRIRT